MTNVLVGLLIPLGIFGGLVGYPILQVIAVRRMRSGWRTAALLPIIPMVIVLAITITWLLRGANLWPLWLIATAPVALIYLAVLFFLHSRRVGT